MIPQRTEISKAQNRPIEVAFFDIEAAYDNVYRTIVESAEKLLRMYRDHSAFHMGTAGLQTAGQHPLRIEIGIPFKPSTAYALSGRIKNEGRRKSVRVKLAAFLAKQSGRTVYSRIATSSDIEI